MTPDTVFALLGRLTVVVGLGVGLVLGGVSCQRRVTQEVRPGFHPLTIKGHTAWVTIAATPQEQERGLMHRERLPEDEGMLFVFPERSFQTFSMKNTLIPLDLAYLDDDGTRVGTIAEIHRMDPEPDKRHHELTSYRSSRPVRYALEVNAGWFQRHEVTTGMEVEGLPHPSTFNQGGRVRLGR